MTRLRWLTPTALALLLATRSARVLELLTGGGPEERLVVVVALATLGASVWLAMRNPPEWWNRLLATPDARCAALVLGLAVGLAIFAPVVTARLPFEQPDILGGRNLAPSWNHILGTDQFSRDLFSRMIYGARVSLAIALISVLVSVTIGTGVGLLAGYRRGATDAFLMRVVDAGIAMPRLILLLVLVAMWEDVGIAALVTILGLTGWFGTARLVRAEVLAIEGADYVQAARGLGLPERRILMHHILPNIAAPIIVSATLGVGQMILAEAGLSFLGFGVQAPMASWGSIINDGRSLLATAPWIATIPGLAIAATVAAIGILGDRLQTILNPREVEPS